ncbi:hypothetical protein BLS_007193 [Venturia inaequalis]|uniref:Uncharacterized protein n=1 Tax=Venturia inaequalis TaxID=5025 RepID=A0A8H3U9X6_VENIN|nr:hypothetical protein BLS_007193 [Venturia inaequalis]
MSSGKLRLPHTTPRLTQLQDSMPPKPSTAKGKEKVTEPGQYATSADTARDGEDRHESEQSPTAEGHHVDGPEVGSNILILSQAQAWKTLDSAKHPHVLQLFDRPEISNNPGAYFLFLETRADGSIKAQVRGPFDINPKDGSSDGTASPQPEVIGTEYVSAAIAATQDTPGLRSDPGAKKSTSNQGAGISNGAAHVENSRTFQYNPEQHLWMNVWCRENKGIKHRDKRMAAAFQEKFGPPRTEAAMKARFQALNESGHLDGPQKTLEFYQDRANEPKKRKDDQRSRRSQANQKEIKPKAQDEDGEEAEQEPDEVMETEVTKPQQSRKRDRSVMDASEPIDLDEDVDMENPPAPKKARRTSSMPQASVNRARGSESPSEAEEEEEEEPYMPRYLGPMATPKSHYPMTKRSGPQLLSALPEDEPASVVSSGPTNSISPEYGGTSFTAINTRRIQSPAAPSSFTAGGTALLPRPSSSGGENSSGGKNLPGAAVRDDADTDMDME